MKEFNISLYLIITVHCKCVILSVVNAFLLTGFKQKKKKRCLITGLYFLVKLLVDNGDLTASKKTSIDFF